MLKSILFYFLFFILNFGGLALGALFTKGGVSSDWYTSLDQAPWTPPGFVFGLAWTFLMLCFTLYLTILYPKVDKKKPFCLLFGLLWLLNVSWNPLFFKWHQTEISLIFIVSLTALIAYTGVKYQKKMKWLSLLIAPYFIWLTIATSLNAYIVFFN